MENKYPLGEVIATRNLEFVYLDGRKEVVAVSIGKPIQGENEHQWWCPYLIQAESFKKQFRMAGGESMQALILTVYIISVELEVLARDHNGTFTYFGETDLGRTYALTDKQRICHRKQI